jgi:hypothetical protein
LFVVCLDSNKNILSHARSRGAFMYAPQIKSRALDFPNCGCSLCVCVSVR